MEAMDLEMEIKMSRARSAPPSTNSARAKGIDAAKTKGEAARLEEQRKQVMVEAAKLEVLKAKVAELEQEKTQAKVEANYTFGEKLSDPESHTLDYK